MSVDFVPNDHIALGTWEVAGSALSLSAWVQQRTTPNDPRILMKGVGTASADHWWGLMLSGASDIPAFRVFTSAYTQLSASTALVAGTWYHVCGTYDGVNMRIFINGVQEGITAKTGAIKADGSAEVWLGDQPGAPGQRPLDGKLEDVRVYSRALTPAEVETIAVAHGTDNILRGLVSRWLLNEGAPGVVVPAAAGSIKDVVGPNNGTESGSPTFSSGVIRFRRRSG